jgi:hypothetical protein
MVIYDPFITNQYGAGGRKLEGSEMVDPPWARRVLYLYVPYGQDAAMGIDSAIINAITS